jgi:lipopolysaccharide transport system permease protein
MISRKTQHQKEAVVRIAPARGFSLNVGEVFAYRELIYTLTWRDITVRYKQTVLGATWALLQPLMTMTLFTIIFGRVARLPTEGVPYPIFALAALVPWQLFAHAMTDSSNSLLVNERLVTKTYFPRMILPLSSILSGLVDLAISFIMLLALMAWYGIAPTFAILTLPAFLLMAIVAALGVGLWLSALNVQFRDVRYTIGFLTQLWMFASPIAYPSSLVPDRFRLIYSLNPMVGVAEGFRWALFGVGSSLAVLLISLTGSFIVFLSGWIYFRRVESSFADVI